MRLQEALDILGIKINFTDKELKKAYREKMKAVHPDNMNKTNVYSAADVNEAYHLIKNKKGRVDLSKNTCKSYTKDNSYKTNSILISLEELLRLYSYEEIIVNGVRLKYKDLKNKTVIISIKYTYELNGEQYNAEKKVCRNINDEYNIPITIENISEDTRIELKVLNSTIVIENLKSSCIASMNIKGIHIKFDIVRKWQDDIG